MVKETVTIRIDTKTKAALDMIVAELSLQEDRKVTQSEAIWYLVESGATHIADRIQELTSSRKPSPKPKD